MKGNKKEKTDRRSDRKTILKTGHEYTFTAQLGQLKTGQDGKVLLQINMWCPDDFPTLWERKE